MKKFKFKYILIVFIISSIIFSLYSIINKTVNAEENTTNESYIKWVDFSVPYKVLDAAYKLDVDSHNNNSEIKYNWVELISYLACKYYGNFSNYKSSDLTNLVNKINEGSSFSELTKEYKYYSYYLESYNAILNNFLGEYFIQTVDENNNTIYSKKYGLKVFSPIAKGYSFSHYDDFGNSRSYGYKRKHLGNDLMGNIGTPIIAVESGYIEALGWNQYGGWRIGIRSFDGLRYYYYAHLKKDHPYNIELCEGTIVTAGDVIGYLGMTGYSSKENVNNINVPHLHFGLQLVFNEVQKDGVNQIWIDVYTLIEFLRKNTSKVLYNKESKEYYREIEIIDPLVPE